MKNNFPLKFKLFDVFVLIATIVFLIAVFLTTNFVLFADKGNKKVVNIYYQGELLIEYQVDLSTVNEVMVITLSKDKYDKLLGDMQITIDPDKGVCVSEVTCPNHTCEKMGYTNMVGLPLTCIPNGVYVMISSSSIDEDIWIS